MVNENTSQKIDDAKYNVLRSQIESLQPEAQKYAQTLHETLGDWADATRLAKIFNRELLEQTAQQQKQLILKDMMLKKEAQKLGLSREVYKVLVSSRERLTNMNKNTMQLLSNFDALSKIPGIGPIFEGGIAATKMLTNGVFKFGESALTAFQAVKTGGISMAVALKTALAGTGILAVTAAITGAIALFQNALKFNVGGLQVVLGKTMSKLQIGWAKFELATASFLKQYGPLLHNMFEGVASIVLSIADVIFNVLGGAISGIMDGLSSAFGEGDELKDSMTELAQIMSTVGETLGVIFFMFGKVLGVAIKVATIIYDSVIAPILKALGMVFALLGKETNLQQEQERNGDRFLSTTSQSNISNSNSVDNSKIDINIGEVKDKETADYVINRLSYALPNLKKSINRG